MMGLMGKPQQYNWAGSNAVVVVCMALFAALAACEKNSEIKVYRVSKAPLEDSAPQQQDAMPTNTAAPRMPGGLAPAAEAAVTTPPNWEAQPLSQMRQASFLVKDDSGAVADISFVSLGSAAGDVLENVNRWLGQLSQPPITEQKLGEMAQRLHTSLGDVTIVDLAGLPDNADPARDGRIIAAMVTTANSTLFFKMRGNADLTEAQKGEFIKWVAGVCNAQTQAGPPQMAAAPRAGDKRTSDQMENARRLDRNSTLFDALRQLQRSGRRRRQDRHFHCDVPRRWRKRCRQRQPVARPNGSCARGCKRRDIASRSSQNRRHDIFDHRHCGG